MIPPSPDPEYARKVPSTILATYGYMNNLVACLIEDYQKLFDHQQEGAQVMHLKKEDREGHVQRHLFFKSTTQEPLFAIVHEGPGKSYLLL